MTDRNEEAIHFFRENAEEYGLRRAQRIYLEAFQKSKLAMLAEKFRVDLVSRGKRVTEAMLENMALQDPEYINLLEQTQVAREREEQLVWMGKAMDMEHETWRTKQANERAERSRYGA